MATSQLNSLMLLYDNFRWKLVSIHIYDRNNIFSLIRTTSIIRMIDMILKSKIPARYRVKQLKLKYGKYNSKISWTPV